MINNKKDITSKKDIETLVNLFYDKVNSDDILSQVFNDFAKVDWKVHLPIMYSFWDMVLLGGVDYQGNPFPKHIPLPIDKLHFDRWLKLFIQNIDELFEGKTTELAKERAKSIANIFQSKLQFINKGRS